MGFEHVKTMLVSDASTRTTIINGMNTHTRHGANDRQSAAGILRLSIVVVGTHGRHFATHVFAKRDDCCNAIFATIQAQTQGYCAGAANSPKIATPCGCCKGAVVLAEEDVW